MPRGEWVREKTAVRREGAKGRALVLQIHSKDIPLAAQLDRDLCPRLKHALFGDDRVEPQAVAWPRFWIEPMA